MRRYYVAACMTLILGAASETGTTGTIDFAFDGERVRLRQVQGDDADCGFGHAVYADGTFKRTSRKYPVFQKRPE